MPQLHFEQTLPNIGGQSTQVNNSSLSFFPIHIRDSISLLTLHLNGCIRFTTNGTFTQSATVGLYWLTGGTLSLENSISGSVQLSSGDAGVRPFYLGLTATSKTQNIDPGTWWCGVLMHTVGHNSTNNGLYGAFTIAANNAFPGGFLAGRMTVGTAALPASYATSDLDITGTDAQFCPQIILTA